MITNPDEYVTFEGQVADPDNESGISSQMFALMKDSTHVHDNKDLVYFACAMYPDDTVQDASESDFPDAEFLLSVKQFKSLLKMFMRFDEKLARQ